jgi:cephalosporin hydroxylase
MSRASLQQLYIDHAGKASHKWSSYLREYDRLFSAWQDKPISMLEVGIQNGGSLDIWAKYFENALTIVGADIDTRCGELSYNDPRIHLVIGDINNSETIQKILNYSPQFDIVIDDGSHQSEDIIKSFVNYFPYLTDGGFFVVEDLHCSYWQEFGGGLFDPYSSITFFKRLIDIVNFEHWGIEKSRQSLLDGITERYGISFDPKNLEEIHSIEFMNSICVIRKSTKADGIGRHVVVGDYEHVVQGNLFLNDSPYTLDPIFDQKSNCWSALNSPPEEMLPNLQARLRDTEVDLDEARKNIANLESEILGFRNEILGFRNEILGFRNSRSWRLTAPLRLLSDALKMFKKRLQ